MNWLDIAIIIVILFSGFLGFKRGVFKELVLFLGIIIVFILSYYLKNYIGDFLVLNFPFFELGNGLISLNIILYQLIAFIMVAIILYVIYEIIISLTGIFELILRFTIVLGIPSKLLGFFVGIVKGIVISYILLFFISQPAFNLKVTSDSKYTELILKKTPILTKITSDTLSIIEQINNINKLSDTNEINLQIVDLILEKKITSVSVIQKLVDNGKLNIKNVNNIIKKYNGE